MKAKLFFFLLIPIFTFAQIQIGSDIDGESGQFGYSVSLSSDGTVVAIGAPFNSGNGYSSGHVRIYKNQSGTWSQIGDDIVGEATSDKSGSTVSLSSDGTIVAIGAVYNYGVNGAYSGHVRIYQNQSGTWIQQGIDIDGEAANDQFGTSLSLSSDGTVVAIGTPYNGGNGINSGHVRVFQNLLGTWTQLGSDIDSEAAGDRSGISVSLSSDGTVVAIGARNNAGNGINSGHVRIYQNQSGTWTQLGSDIDGEAASDNSGHSVSLSADGTVVAIGAYNNDGNGNNSGQVRIYQNQSGTWTQLGGDIDGEAADDGSGLFVSLSSNGTVVAIGAPYNDGNGGNSGHVRIYKNQSGTWTQLGSDIDGEAAGDQSGISVSLSSNGSVVAIGANFNGGNGIKAGHVRIYDLSVLLSTESFKLNYFSFYPNPVKDVLNIELNKGLELKQVNIYNTLSQYLYSVKTSKMDVSGLTSGIYFVEVETNQGKSAKKMVIE